MCDVSVTLLPHEPIILVTHRGDASDYCLHQTNDAVADVLAQSSLSFAYLLIDNRDMDISFEKLVRVLLESQAIKGVGSPSDPRLRGGALISSNHVFRLQTDSWGRAESHNFPLALFDDLVEAHDYVRQMMEYDGVGAYTRTLTPA